MQSLYTFPMLLLFAPPLSAPPLHISLHILSSPPLHLFSKNHLSASLCAPPLKPLTLSLLLLSELFLWMDGRTHTRGGIGERTERAEWEIKQAVPLWTLIAPFSVPPLHFLSLKLPLQLSLQLHLSLHLSLTYLCTSAMQSFLQGVPYYWAHFLFAIFSASGAHTEELFIAIG